MSVRQVTSLDDFKAKINEAGGKLVIVDFYATWCGPCKVIAPKIEAMSQQKTNVVFLKVDVDECEDVAQEYKITCMPTFVFIKDGQKVDSFSGANEEKIKEYLEKYE